MTDSLAGLVAPVGDNAFLRDHWNRDMLYVQGPAGRFHDLASWDQINAMLANNRLQPPRFELVKRGVGIDAARWTHERGDGRILNAGAVSAQLSRGATLIVSFVEEILPEVRRLSDGVCEALRARCNVNLYAGWRADQGFNLHWDTHDVFVLQVHGRKKWRVFQPTLESPVRTRREDVPKPDGEPYWEGVLEDGAMLYLPRGWWHDATPLDEPSLHLTIAVTPPAARDYLRWLMDRLERQVIGRSDIPRVGDEEAKADYFAQLRDAMLAEWDSDGPDRFLEEFDARRFALPVFDLPKVASLPTAGIQSDTRVRLASFRRLAVETTMPGDQILVHNGTQTWPAHRAIAPALRMLRSNADRTFDDLRAALGEPGSEQELRKQLLLWAAAGVVFLDFGA